MLKKILFFITISTLLLTGCSQATDSEQNPVQETPVSQEESQAKADSLKGEDLIYYKDVTGYFAGEKNADRPGLVLIQEWWGLNNEIKAEADKFADLGYNVLAVDLYNGKVATTREEAQEFRNAVDQEEAIANMQAAVEYLRANGSTKIGSLGWCFGGQKSLQLALSGSDLDATVIYYGNVETPKDQLATIKWPVLGIFGDADQVVPVSEVEAFEASLNELNIDNEIYMYEGVGHAFANPTNQDFAPEETKDAMEKTVEFLERTLKS